MATIKWVNKINKQAATQATALTRMGSYCSIRSSGATDIRIIKKPFIVVAVLVGDQQL
jgi:hypothetical protein